MDQSIAKGTRFPFIPGTKPSIKNSQLLISTGIPSLDHLIGLKNLFYFTKIKKKYFRSITVLEFNNFRWWITYWISICCWYV